MNKYYCQLAAIVGNWDKSNEKMVKDDFYTMVMKNSEGNKGIRQERLDKPGNPTPTFPFDESRDRDNFINYLKTDFSRFCFSLLKNGCDCSLGEMSLVPWLDFSQEWDDEKLFKHFGVDEKTQNYIREFLPDFHKIRKEIS